MNIRLITIGSVKEAYYRDKIKELSSLISKKTKLDIIELPDESIPKNAGQAVMDGIKKKEGERILHEIKNTDYVIALCIEGKLTNQNELKELLQKAEANDKSVMDFVIGGSLGLDEAVVKRANYKLSFSKMTFPHQLMRVMLLEQLCICCK